jgi:hypothetical protein
MDDVTILDQITGLVEREHHLRAARQRGGLSETAELDELADTEQQLDQCWDLLRQRRAKRQYGENPDDAEARPATQVEGYSG